MNDPPNSLPSREQEVILHRRLLELDPTAPSDLAVAYLDHLIAWVRARNPRIDADLCAEGAEEALVSLIKNPCSYDSSRQTLVVYLQMSASGDVLNLLQKAGRRSQKKKSLNSVELLSGAGKYLGKDDDPSFGLLRMEEERLWETVLLDVRDGLSEAELSGLELVLKGEKKTAAFAGALDIGHLPKDKQAAEVKRVKDMLKNRIKRARSRHDQSST